MRLSSGGAKLGSNPRQGRRALDFESSPFKDFGTFPLPHVLPGASSGIADERSRFRGQLLRRTVSPATAGGAMFNQDLEFVTEIVRHEIDRELLARRAQYDDRGLPVLHAQNSSEHWPN